MPNGRPGDDPLTDVLAHGLPGFTPRIDELLREVAKLRMNQVWAELHGVVDRYLGRKEDDLDDLERELYAMLEQLRTKRPR